MDEETIAWFLIVISFFGILIFGFSMPNYSFDPIEEDFSDSNLTRIEHDIYHVDGKSQFKLRLRDGYKRASYNIDLSYAEEIELDDSSGGVKAFKAFRTENSNRFLNDENRVHKYVVEDANYIKVDVDGKEDELKEKYKASKFSIIGLIIFLVSLSIGVLLVTFFSD